MQSVNVTELRLHLRNYLEQVQQGGEISIIRHGKAVAYIVSDYQQSRRDAAWDGFFINGPAVSDDFMNAPASQQQNERDNF